MTNESALTRRGVVATGAVVAAAALAACATYGKEDASPANSSAPDSGRPAGKALAKTVDIPVGGGVIVGDTVVTQPSAGTFVGLSAICTHAGCTVSSVSGGTINCPCHGSKYRLDGTVSHGPAPRALAPKPVRVVGDSVMLG
ncbi:Rieske-like 2Fe-2S protein [Nocardia tenerifensis]|uniref:Cytochrome bc1 complex Rieske iron-sulfur subunit n=1 Tax=Nocardia tenerifensis TaxID=228006 RepID=A0A318K2W7_9NOCA|nr:Rieske (2Fe-2S) protein [Nocardia tenerifensis]PXX62352.1 Rieske-like 2Fe-2S protein [Nocardia tenerifensis]